MKYKERMRKGREWRRRKRKTGKKLEEEEKQNGEGDKQRRIWKYKDKEEVAGRKNKGRRR